MVKKNGEKMYRIYSEHLTDKEYKAWLEYMYLIQFPLCENWHKNNTFCQINEEYINENGND